MNIDSANSDKIKAAAVRVMVDEGFVLIPGAGGTTTLVFSGKDTIHRDRLVAANAVKPAASKWDYLLLDTAGRADSEFGQNFASGGFVSRDVEGGDFDPRQNSIVTLRLFPMAGRTTIVGYVSARFQRTDVMAAAGSDPALKLLLILESGKQLSEQLAKIKRVAEMR